MIVEKAYQTGKDAMLKDTQEFWTEIWKRHFNGYVNAAPWQAFYLYFILDRTDIEILEIAAGSFHDTFCLNEWGIPCTGIDLCPTAVDLARKKTPSLSHKTLVMDAQHLGFENKSFDISFHNGFFANIQDANILRAIIQEQVRVTRKKIICTVHNRLNKSLINKFKMLSKKDELYNVRFFYPDEITSLMVSFCQKVAIFPIQIPEFDELFYVTRDKDLMKSIYLHHYLTIDMHKCKRLMVVGYL
jgi:hypothetical protein